MDRSDRWHRPIPNADQAVVSEEKVRGYLLNFNHPDGGTKAIWFHALGYKASLWKQLADDLLAIAKDCKDFDTETTPYGVKYKAYGQIGRPNRRPGSVMTVWISEPNRPPRLIIAYPDTPS